MESNRLPSVRLYLFVQIAIDDEDRELHRAPQLLHHGEFGLCGCFIAFEVRVLLKALQRMPCLVPDLVKECCDRCGMVRILLLSECHVP